MGKYSCILLFILCVSCSQDKRCFEKKEISECLGDILWNEFCKESVEYDLETVLNTIRKNAKGEREASKNPRMELSKHIEKANERSALIALRQGEDFLKNVSRQKGSIALRPGRLLYKVVNSGTGSTITESSSPLMHFVEKDLEGEILYDTRKSNSPMRLALNETVLGFKLGVIGMKVGERREIFVHPDLAYKKLGKTKPNQLLIYDVTVLQE